MSEKLHSEILDRLRNVTHKGHPILSGTVVTVDANNALMDVLLTIDDESSPTRNVLLSAVSGNLNGLILIPALKSNVVVAQVDGTAVYTVVKCSNLDKIIVKLGDTSLTIDASGTVWNNGSNGGLPITPKLVERINKIENLLNAFINNYNAHVHSGVQTGGGVSGITPSQEANMIAPITAIADIENTKIKQ